MVSIWLLGIGVGAVNIYRNIRRLKRFFGRAELQKSGKLYELFKDVRHRFGIHENVPLLVSKEVVTPGIAGIFNPRIILPRRCVEGLNEEELRCVFVHELTHYRRGDLFVHHVLLLVCCIHWFNPMVWFVLRAFRSSMEQACDASVIQTACIRTAKQYGYTILQVVQQAGSVPLANAGALCLLGNRKSSALKERIRLIARPKKANAVFTALGVMCFGSALAFAITGEADPKIEALRLMKLTRVASPFFQSNEVESIEKKGPAELAAFLSEYTSSWVTSLDLSSVSAGEASLDAKLRIHGSIRSTELWVWISDRSGDIMSFRKLDNVELVADRRRQNVSVNLDIPDEAYELCYGLFFSGGGQAWLEDIQMSSAVNTEPDELLAAR